MDTIISLLSPSRQRRPPPSPDEPHKSHTKTKTYSKKDRIRGQRALARISGGSDLQTEPSRLNLASAAPPPVEETEEIVTVSQRPLPDDEDIYNAPPDPKRTKKSPKRRSQTAKTTKRVRAPVVQLGDKMDEDEDEDMHNATLEPSFTVKPPKPKRSSQTEQRTSGARVPVVQLGDEMEVEDEDIYNAPPEPSVTIKSRKQKSKAIKKTSRAESPGTPAVVEMEVAEANEYEERFKRFIGHRWVGDSIEIRVEWEQGPPTWEPEQNLHEDALDALLAYWKDQGGRPLNPRDPELYDIFAVRKHSRNRKKVYVEWVGFGKKDQTWLATSVVEETAPELLEEYWKSLPSKKKA